MKRRRLFIFSFLLLTIAGYTQQFKRKSFLEFSFGPSMPIGKYAQTGLSNSSHGFANPGQLLRAGYTSMVNKHFGWTAALHANRNPIDKKSYESELAAYGFYGIIAGPLPPTSPQPYPRTYKNWKMDNAAWLFVSLMGGGYAETTAGSSERLRLTARAMVGVAFAKSPSLYGESNSDTTTATMARNDKQGVGFSYALSGGAKYVFNSKLFVLANLEYLGTSAIKFKDVTSRYYASERTRTGMPIVDIMQSVTQDRKQSVASINLHLGIGLNL